MAASSKMTLIRSVTSYLGDRGEDRTCSTDTQLRPSKEDSLLSEARRCLPKHRRWLTRRSVFRTKTGGSRRVLQDYQSHSSV